MDKRPFVRMLTGGDLVIESSTQINWRGRSTRALFALLALDPGKEVSRDRLAGVMWPEDDQQAARDKLRNTLYSLRRQIVPVHPSLILSENEWIMLDVARESIDAILFEGLCGGGDVESRIAALDLYDGDLLATFSAPSEAVNELLRYERERLRGLAAGTGLALIASFREANDFDRVNNTARKVLTVEPANEPAHRAMMRTFAELGDRASALHQFDQCRAALNEHYNVEPSQETIDLRNKIAESDIVRPSETIVQVDDTVGGEAGSDQSVMARRGRAVWFLLPALFATVAVLIWPVFAPPEQPDRTSVVLSLRYDKSDRHTVEIANNVRTFLEDRLSPLTGRTLLTRAVPFTETAPAFDQGIVVNAAILRSGTDTRIFFDLRQGGQAEPIWHDKTEFGLQTPNDTALFDWIAGNVVPAILSEIGRSDKPPAGSQAEGR